MAGGSQFIWIPLLLLCVLQTFENAHVHYTSTRPEVDSEVGNTLSKMPITLPNGYIPKNVNVTSISIKTCTGTEEQLQQTVLRNRQLDEEAFGLRREARLLKLQLATCSLTASAIAGSYRTQLQNKMKQLLETFDSDTFQILKVIQLTREVKALQKRIKLADNSTETTTATSFLQKELQERTDELNSKKQEIERSHPNSTLILQIISLQNEIWDLEQEDSKKGQSSLPSDKRIMALQEQLEKKINELRDNGDASSDMLELLSVHTKIAAIQRLISVHIEKSKTNAADYQRQWRQKADLLKKKILELNRDENNKELTKEILILQGEVESLRQLMLNAKKITDIYLIELRVVLEKEKKQQERLHKILEENEYAQAQMIMKIISIMKDVRELQNDEQQQTSTSQTTSLLVLLQAKEKEFAIAQAEISELKRKLKIMTEKYSGVEEIYDQAKIEFEQNIAELNRTGGHTPALILNVINLHDEFRILKSLISITEDPDRISELKRKLEKTQEELNSKNADIQRMIANPQIFLTIIGLQNKIWDLQKNATNGTINKTVKELQARLDGLISEIDNNGDDNTKLMLKIITVQSQVEQLQRQLSELHILQSSQVIEFRNDLTTKQTELQKYIDELNEKNQTNSRLILKVTQLHSQLRNLEEERHMDNETSSLTISQLRKELRSRMVERTRDQAEMKVLKALLQANERKHAISQAKVLELQKKLQLKSEECSGLAGRYEQINTEFEQRIAELNRTGDSKAALVLKVMNLHDELMNRRDLILTTKDPEMKSKLISQQEKKQHELHYTTTDINRLFAYPQTILTIIELQNEIRDLQKTDTDGTKRNRVEELYNRVHGFISEIDDGDNETLKLTLKILTLQSQIEQLKKHLSNDKLVNATQVTELKNDLASKKNELQKYINDLDRENKTNANLILTITSLKNQLRNLQLENQDENEAVSATITKLREQLRTKEEEHFQDQAEIKALQNKLNQTDAQCSSFEQKLKGLQNELDDKMHELLSKTDTVTSLALQVSTLTLQLEELKRQLQNTESKTKIEELQKVIYEKNNELANKTEELKARSSQAQRLLQIITLQTQIEKLSIEAINDTDYEKIVVLQGYMSDLIGGIQDENDENTKLMFQILAQQDEIARLKKQEETQTNAQLKKIGELQNELEDIRNQIKEKTLMLESSDTRITNLSAQIMELHWKIQPLEDEISYLEQANAENVAELQTKLSLTKRQLQDSELRLKDLDTKNFNSIMEIADLRAQLKKAQKQASKAAGKNINELEQQLQTEQREIKKLVSRNKDLKQEVENLKTCCIETNDCGDVHRQLQQSQEDADRLQQQLQDKDTHLNQMQEELVEQARVTETLQSDYSNLERQFQQSQDMVDNLQKQLLEKDASLNQLKQELEERTTENNKLEEDYNNLQNEKNKLEESLQDLQNKLSDVEDPTIHTRKIVFDPNTAHPRIALSADNTEMSTRVEAQNVPDYPGRFDVDLAVLGTTGYSSGRQYWEVSVVGKRCYHLGMTSESAQRKGSISYSPANGYWTIILNKQGQFKAADRRAVTIQVQVQPLSLGILLDYKRGQISFYDAGSRSLLYSFVGQTFTDKIYPFVNFCVEDVANPTPIVLLTPDSVDWIK
ncbi:putative leucine-rich repeat-containing protein DDB_G0290503 isoform X2 [Channa argus]|uniref:putative leucine-rich repeat-containing protein DDB_G0290503 isoform X2 n=1 Tax=Channa argus TaxID=215402 RepID=UPI0029483BF4|nr:hypothetical protein Q8A73_015172 [Channa argus]